MHMGRKILFITTDQQRWDSLGCNGNKFCRTPNIDALAASGADLIFLDVMMPIMDGPEALSRIRADASLASFASTPVVMMTAAPSALVAASMQRPAWSRSAVTASRMPGFSR